MVIVLVQLHDLHETGIKLKTVSIFFLILEHFYNSSSKSRNFHIINLPRGKLGEVAKLVNEGTKARPRRDANNSPSSSAKVKYE
jgi:hypothetical protein